MLPTLRDGDLLLARRFTGQPLRVGDVVVLRRPPGVDRLPPGAQVVDGPVPPPRGGRLIKRVAELVPPDAMIVLGDSPGYDSRLFGPVPVRDTIAVMIRPLTR